MATLKASSFTVMDAVFAGMVRPAVLVTPLALVPLNIVPPLMTTVFRLPPVGDHETVIETSLMGRLHEFVTVVPVNQCQRLESKVRRALPVFHAKHPDWFVAQRFMLALTEYGVPKYV